MQLTLLGTGCPKVDYKRFGPANLISTSKTHILVDCGSGVTQRLNQLNICTSKINALFLTHLHSDHVVDLYQLIISSWHSYRTKPWFIYGPTGTKKFVKKLMNTWKDERTLRIRYEKRESIEAFNMSIQLKKHWNSTEHKMICWHHITIQVLILHTPRGSYIEKACLTEM